MAKLTILEIFNEIQRNIGISELSTLSGLSSGFNYKIWQWINQELLKLSINHKWKPLEETGTITLVTSTQTYAKPSDMVFVDRYSFIYNSSSEVTYRTAQEIDFLYQDQDNDGTPEDIYEYGSNFVLPTNITSAVNGKTILYRYWKLPTALSTSSNTATTWIPEGFDRSVLIPLVSMRALQYRRNSEYQEYRDQVYGKDGSLDYMKLIHGSPTSNRVRVTAHL